MGYRHESTHRFEVIPEYDVIIAVISDKLPAQVTILLNSGVQKID